MNIFVTSSDPELSANFLDDVRANKMFLESVQMLSTVAATIGQGAIPYKKTHHKHPCTVWAGSNAENYWWLIKHTQALMQRVIETHKTRQAFSSIIENPAFSYTEKFPESFCNCSGFEEQDVFSSYVRCLENKWSKDKRQPTFKTQFKK